MTVVSILVINCSQPPALQVDPGVSEVFLGLNEQDLGESFAVQVLHYTSVLVRLQTKHILCRLLCWTCPARRAPILPPHVSALPPAFPSLYRCFWFLRFMVLFHSTPCSESYPKLYLLLFQRYIQIKFLRFGWHYQVLRHCNLFRIDELFLSLFNCRH